MNNSPVKSELYVALEMVELTQFLPFTKFSSQKRFILSAHTTYYQSYPKFQKPLFINLVLKNFTYISKFSVVF